MYFYKQKGKRYLDLSGNLILSHNANFVTSSLKSIAPDKIINSFYVCNISKLSIWKKIKTSFRLIWFIWIKPKNLLMPAVSKTVRNVKTGNITKTIKKTKSIGISSTIEINKCQCTDKKEQPLNQCDECPR